MDYTKLFAGKRILVVGGTGSIGSVIVRELLKYNPKQVRVYSRDESKHQELLFSIDEKHHAKIRSLVGDIRDRDRLHFAMREDRTQVIDLHPTPRADPIRARARRRQCACRE